MRLTDEMIQEDDKRFKRQDLLAEFNYCGKEVPKRKSITNDDIRFYAWLCRSAYTLLKEQEAKIEHMKRPDCEHAEHDGIGCLGYCGCTQDDEPIESCKRCEMYTGNVYEEMKWE